MAKFVAASPVSSLGGNSSSTLQAWPRISRWRAMTKPSPALLPLPQRITTGPLMPSRSSTSTVPRPAFSISTRPGMPYSSIARRSSWRHCSRVRTKFVQHCRKNGVEDDPARWLAYRSNQLLIHWTVVARPARPIERVSGMFFGQTATQFWALPQILDAAGGHQRVEPFAGVHLAGAVAVEEHHLADRRGADEAFVVRGVLAGFEILVALAFAAA